MKDIKKYSMKELLDLIDYRMTSENKCQYEVLRDLAIDSRYIGKIRYKLGRQLRVSTSSLSTRIAYCSKIIDGVLTVREVSNITGYTTSSIYTWLKDYKEYGSSMVDRAIAFRH